LVAPLLEDKKDANGGDAESPAKAEEKKELNSKPNQEA